MQLVDHSKEKFLNLSVSKSKIDNPFNITMEKSNVDVSVDKVLRLSARGWIPPRKLSDLENDVGFITNTVDDLVNYYTNTEIDIKLENIRDTTIEVVDVLPPEGKPGVLYMLKEGQRIVAQYFWNVNEWALVGNEYIDLNLYYTKTEIDEKLKIVTSTIATTEQLGLIKSAEADVSEDNTRLNVVVDPVTGIASVKFARLRETPGAVDDVFDILNQNMGHIQGGDAKGIQENE